MASGFSQRESKLEKIVAKIGVVNLNETSSDKEQEKKASAQPWDYPILPAAEDGGRSLGHVPVWDSNHLERATGLRCRP